MIEQGWTHLSRDEGGEEAIQEPEETEGQVAVHGAHNLLAVCALKLNRFLSQKGEYVLGIYTFS